MQKHDWVVVKSQDSDLWKPNDDGVYPQPRVERNLVDNGKSIQERGKAVILKEKVELVGKLGQVSHVTGDPGGEEEGEPVGAPTFCVRFSPDEMAQCYQDWFFFREEELETIEPTEDQIVEYFEAWL